MLVSADFYQIEVSVNGWCRFNIRLHVLWSLILIYKICVICPRRHSVNFVPVPVTINNRCKRILMERLERATFFDQVLYATD